MSVTPNEPYDESKHDEQRLIDELEAFYAQHGLTPRCAFEQFHALLPESPEQDTPEKQAQRAWLADYHRRWDEMLEWHRLQRERNA